jgi:hypothetical protein
MELAKFLVLRSPNIGNIGTVKERPSGFTNPDYYEISESELEEFKAMSNAHKKAFIQEKLSEKQNQIIAAMPEKKNVEVVEVEPKLVEITENIEEMTNEEISAAIDAITDPTFGNIIENKEEVEIIENTELAVDIKPKAKGRPKKTN